MRLRDFLDDNRFQTFLPFNDIENLLEMFDASIKIIKTNEYSWADFERSFEVYGEKYTFLATFVNDEAIVGFHRKNDFTYSPLRSGNNANKVFAGAFECVKAMLLERPARYITFSTNILEKEPRNKNNGFKKTGFKKTVVDIYNSQHFKNYIKNRFGFELVNQKSTPTINAWQYKLMQKLENIYFSNLAKLE